MHQNTTRQNPPHLPAAQAVAGGSLTFADILAEARNAATGQSLRLSDDQRKEAVARAFVSHLSGLILHRFGPEADEAFCRALGFDHLIGVGQ